MRVCVYVCLSVSLSVCVMCVFLYCQCVCVRCADQSVKNYIKRQIGKEQLRQVTYIQ